MPRSVMPEFLSSGRILDFEEGFFVVVSMVVF